MQETILAIQNDVSHDDISSAKQKMTLLDDQWRFYSSLFTLYIPHNRLEPVTEGIDQMKICLEVESYDEFFFAAKRTSTYIKSISEIEKPRAGNIF